MKIITAKLVTFAAIALLGAGTVAQAHPQHHSQKHQSHKHQSHQHSIANNSVHVIARLPASSIRISLNGRNYYKARGKYYQRANKGWRVVAVPTTLRSAQRAEAMRRAH